MWRDGDRVRTVELLPAQDGRARAIVDGVEIALTIERIGADRLRLSSDEGVIVAEVTVAGTQRFVRLGRLDFVFDREEGRSSRGAASTGSLEAPMPGVVTRVLVAAGDAVEKGQPLMALEAMKMEHVIRAPREGVVKRVAARPGEMVNGGIALIEFEAS